MDSDTASLVKSRIVLHKRHELFYSIMFDDLDDDEPEPNPDLKTTLYLRRDTWDDFDKPDEITVTVEPGDKLNERDS